MKRIHFVFIFVIILSLLIRLYHLGYHDLWYDEVATVSYLKYPWLNWNAPLYWIFMHLWCRVFPLSEFYLRLPSLLFNFLSLIFLFLLGKELFNERVGLFSASIMGLSPFHLWYAQEARDYSMVLFFGTLSSFLLFKAAKTRDLKLWLSFFFVSVCGFYTNYFYILLFLAQALWILFVRRGKINLRSLLLFLAVPLSFIFYLPRFLSKFFYVWEGFWIPEPKGRSLLITLENFLFGYNGTFSLYLIGDVLTAVGLILVIMGYKNYKEYREGVKFCFILFLFPLGFAYIFSHFLFSIYLDRGFLLFSPYFYLLLSFGICALRRDIKILTFFVLFISLIVSDIRYFKDEIYEPLEHHVGTYIKKPVQPIVEFVNKNLDKSDIVAFTNPCVMPSMVYYGLKHRPYFIFSPNVMDTNWDRPYRESRFCLPVYKLARLNFGRLLVIASDWARSGRLDENSQDVKKWLDRNLRLNSKREIQGVWIFEYVKQ